MTSGRTVVPPPLDGTLSVIPGLVDFHATHNAELPWAFLASDAESPVVTVSFLEFAQATHRAAHALRPGRQGPENEIVGVLVNCDTVLYVALIAGMIRAGLIPLLLSPRNSAPAISNLLKRTSCHKIITQPSFSSIMSDVHTELKAEGHTLHSEEPPATDHIFPTLYANASSMEIVVEPYPASPEPAIEDIGYYLHSSGSTGLPKPIHQRYIDMLDVCLAHVHQDAAARGVIWGSMACPTFHAFGVNMQLHGPLATGLPAALFAPKFPASPIIPTPQNTLQACKAIGCDGLTVVPAFVEAWAKSDADIEYLKTMQVVVYAGGPLSTKTGNKLVAAGVRLSSVYAGTEFGPQTKIFDMDMSPNPAPGAKTREDWEWLTFSDRVKIRMVPEGDGTYEAQFLTCDTHRPCVENLPDVRGYATSDLFEPHPTKKDLWRLCGRKDDVLVLGSGEKVVPIPQESLISSSPVAQGAVMFGRGKNECGILVEPRSQHAIDPSDNDALAKFRNAIWPVVEEANQLSPTFARLFKEMILVTSPSKPLIRAGKGTVIRKQSLTLYEKEIEDLYRTVEDSAGQEGIAPPLTWSAGDVETWLQSHTSSISAGKVISPSSDVFEQGFDSLHATFLRNRIVGALRSDPQTRNASRNVSQNFVFEHPTLRKLAGAIATIANGEPTVSGQDLEKHVNELIQKYSTKLPVASPRPSPPTAGLALLVIGSTGNVGSHVLAALLATSSVTKIYTLDRPSSVVRRQQASFIERGLDSRLLNTHKLVPLIGDVTQMNFGLDHQVFMEIRDTVTHVLHNAWRVDFNLSLSSFESNIAGARKVIDFCATVPHSVSLLFTSSVSATAKWDISLGPVPEDIVADSIVATSSGYGASKYVTERILADAASNGSQCTSLRLGQVCGPKSTGTWSTTEWLPIIIKSSMALGVLPDLTGTVSWLPADAVANTIVDLVSSQEPLPRVLNLVHPKPISWRTILQDLNECLDSSLSVVSYAEWLSKLEEAATKSDTIERVPATKLLEFFRGLAAGEAQAARATGSNSVEAGGLPVYTTIQTQRLSPSVRNYGVLDGTYTKAWIKYWKQVGFLQ